MAKILSIKELQDSMWPEWLQETFGENLISAFLHGDCLMEGFNPFKEPWQISFLLKENTPNKLIPLQDLLRQAEKFKIQFSYFFTSQFFDSAKDTFPLEFLHISKKNFPILGDAPLKDFIPEKKALRLQCERELRGLIIRLRSNFVYRLRKRTSLDFFLEAERVILPILYGVHFLETMEYPESKDSIRQKYPFLQLQPPGQKDNIISEQANNYILEIEKILKLVDSMEV